MLTTPYLSAAEGPTVTDNLHIRERRPEELSLEIEIWNSSLPPDLRLTAEEVAAWEHVETSEDVILRLLAFVDGTAAGRGVAAHRQHYAPGSFELDVVVCPEYRRRGIGRQIYAHLLDFARAQGARELECEVWEPDLPRIERWLEREGFRETSRMMEVELRLADFDAGAHVDARERATASGITFTTFAQETDEERWRKLWSLSNRIRRDIPYGGSPRAEETLAHYRRVLSAPHVLHDCLVVARDGDRYVGFSILVRQTAERALTWTTGVDPEYRGRGVATALKVRSALLARDRGYTVMRTLNHVDNPAMRAVNKRLGYVPLQELVMFTKRLVE